MFSGNVSLSSLVSLSHFAWLSLFLLGNHFFIVSLSISAHVRLSLSQLIDRLSFLGYQRACRGIEAQDDRLSNLESKG